MADETNNELDGTAQASLASGHPAFDLDAYLARIGLARAPSRDAAGLAALLQAHRMAIPFENVDLLLGRGADIAPSAVFDKLVRRKRGGYGFEQNSLFGLALKALGFQSRPLLARVWSGAGDAVPARNHMLHLVTIGDESFIVDAGLGRDFAPPLPLRDGATAEALGVSHRLDEDGEHGWTYSTRQPGSDEWVPQYSFTMERVWPADIDQANHYASTHPLSPYVGTLFAHIVLPSGGASLTDRSYSRRSSKGAEKSEISSPKMLQIRLSLMFGIDLSNEEIARIRLFDEAGN